MNTWYTRSIYICTWHIYSSTVVIVFFCGYFFLMLADLTAKTKNNVISSLLQNGLCRVQTYEHKGTGTV